MLNFPPSQSVFIFRRPVDMRCGFDRLAAYVQSSLSRQVVSGGVYVFLGKRRDRIKLLWFDHDGYCLLYKRLEVGVFRVEQGEGHEEITGVDLTLLMQGMELGRIKMRKKLHLIHEV